MERIDEQQLFGRLKNHPTTEACSHFLLSQPSLHRNGIYTSLLFDRLHRKMEVVNELHREAVENWNQTFYLLYFRTLGDSRNQQAYLSLARKVSYKTVLRERLVPHAVEAMLFGASGLLDLYRDDDYTLTLRRLFEHLAAKYEITPMHIDEWTLGNIRPANHPVLRLAQAAEFFSQDEFVMNRAMSCRCEEDICRMFCIATSDYWRTHYIPGTRSDEQPKRIGRFKANIIGINLVALLQFAYGSYTGSESLRDNALSLLERLPAESNRYITAWQEMGLSPQNAFESQSLLQLSTQYCTVRRCEECPVGKRLVDKILRSTPGEEEQPL